jgi:hypothetical protein
MKMTMSLILLSFSLVPFAYAERVNECSIPGMRLSSEFVGLISDESRAAFQRSGATDVPSEKTFSSDIVATISKNFKNKYCEVEHYTVEEQQCTRVDSSVALGRGNAILKSFYDLSSPTLTRSQSFLQNVSYDMNADATLRLETAKTIVNFLTKKASTSSIPTNWDDFASALNELAASGVVNKVIIDDLTINYLDQNKVILGFTPMKDVTIKEGAGNNSFKTLFDLSTSEFERVKVIQNSLLGLTTTDKAILARSFIDFASNNGIPSNWAQFSLMLKSSADQKILSESELKDITGKNEFTNRANLGFEIEAKKCVAVVRDAQVNVITERMEREFQSKSTKKVTISVANAPLLPGESEEFTAHYDGLNPAFVTVNSSFNTYEVSSKSTGDELSFSLTGKRVRVAARNTSYAMIIKTNDMLDVSYQNKGYNPKVGGKVTVIVDFYETRFWGDKLLGSRIVTPVDGNLVKYLAQVKMLDASKKPYIVIKMKYEGSGFYTEDFTEKVRFDF